MEQTTDQHGRARGDHDDQQLAQSGQSHGRPLKRPSRPPIANADTPATATDASCAARPLAKNHGSSGASAPAANVRSEENAAAHGDLDASARSDLGAGVRGDLSARAHVRDQSGAIIRTTRGIEPSISSSRAQISGTSEKPSCRAA